MGRMEFRKGRKCNDCGQPINEEPKHSRKDVCPECWQTRFALISGEIVPPGSPEFQEIQRKMRSGRGTAKAYIDRLRGMEGRYE